jgi:hypothetical protein
MTALEDFLKSQGIDYKKPGTTPSTAKPSKSGTFTRTQESVTMPNDASLVDDINKYYQKYYGRNATPQESIAMLPEAKAQYLTPDGQTKSTVKETYKNGQLVNTQYLTNQGTNIGDYIDARIKQQYLSGGPAVNKLNIPEGPAGQYFTNLKNLAFQNGIPLSDDAARQHAMDIVAGKADENTVSGLLRESAASLYPQFADKIKAGVNLKTLADPYMQTMSNILEIPSASIDLSNDTIKSALNAVGPDGKPQTKSLYEFEQQLRNDPRWGYTQNARQSLDNVGLQVLRNFGLAY